MLSLRNVASSLCAACSYEESVFRKSFEAASQGIESAKPQMTSAPVTSAPTMER